MFEFWKARWVRWKRTGKKTTQLKWPKYQKPKDKNIGWRKNLWWNFDHFYTKLFKIISTQNHLGKTSNFFHIFCFEQYQTYIFYKSYLHWNTFIFDGHIWYWSHVFCPPQSNCKFCLDCWLVKAWKSSSGIGWLKLSNGNISERVNKYYFNLFARLITYFGNLVFCILVI